jgi:hypothetical protein
MTRMKRILADFSLRKSALIRPIRVIRVAILRVQLSGRFLQILPDALDGRFIRSQTADGDPDGETAVQMCP